jgi:hypothetical protein
MLARRAIGAVDQYTVLCFLSDLPDAVVGDVDPLVPADIGDERVDVLVSELEGRPWRAWSLAGLSSYLMAALDAWQADRDSFHSGLRRFLEGH